jgi:aspartate aminotransferase
MSDTASMLSARARQLAPSITLAVTAKAKALKAAGVDVIGFGAGEPDFDTPTFIKDAAKTALDEGITKYTPAPATLDLRKAIAQKFERDNNLAYDPLIQISVGAGGKHCLYTAMQAVLDPGDEVVVMSPYWVSYPEQAKLAGAKVVEVVGDEAAGFKATPEQLAGALTAKTKMVLLNSPSNPAGHGYTKTEQAALGRVLADHSCLIFSDEIYEHLVYGDFEHVSFAAACPDLFDRTLTFNCHSKSFSMTGWRLGYVGGPAAIIKAMNGLISQMTSHVTSFTQPAAALALTDPRGLEAVAEMRGVFEGRLKLMHGLLSDLPGVTCVRPQGAFYCFPNISAHLGEKYPTAVEFAATLLEEAYVAVVPGNDSGFETHVRLSFATSEANIEKGIGRIAEWLG